MAQAERDLLADRFQPQWLQPGDTLIREGETPDAMFLIASGTAEMSIREPAGSRVVYRMSPGESLGAIGLITGVAYKVTATALTEMKAFRLDKVDVAVAIRLKPELALAFEIVAQRSQDAIGRRTATQEDAPLDHGEIFLSRIRSFMRLLNS
jgi:CRP-like cAMP-binding protein